MKLSLECLPAETRGRLSGSGLGQEGARREMRCFDPLSATGRSALNLQHFLPQVEHLRGLPRAYLLGRE